MATCSTSNSKMPLWHDITSRVGAILAHDPPESRTMNLKQCILNLHVTFDMMCNKHPWHGYPSDIMVPVKSRLQRCFMLCNTCVISKCTEYTGAVSTLHWRCLVHYNFPTIYKLITTLIINFWTCWKSLVNKTHHYHKGNLKNTQYWKNS